MPYLEHLGNLPDMVLLPRILEEFPRKSMLACQLPLIIGKMVPLGWYPYESTPYTPYIVGIYWVHPL